MVKKNKARSINIGLSGVYVISSLHHVNIPIIFCIFESLFLNKVVTNLVVIIF